MTDQTTRPERRWWQPRVSQRVSGGSAIFFGLIATNHVLRLIYGDSSGWLPWATTAALTLVTLEYGLWWLHLRRATGRQLEGHS